MNRIYVDQIMIPDTQRRLRPHKVAHIARKMQERGYNESYPVTLEPDAITLVDGGHRIRAARQAGIESVPYITTDQDPITHAINCNLDGTDTEAHDVFDLAELCWQLSRDGLTGIEIADRLGWGSAAKVTYHANIKTKISIRAWNLVTIDINRNSELLSVESKEIVNSKLTNVNWQESHFRAFLKHLPDDGTRSVMRAQVRAIKMLIDSKAITAKKAESVAKQYAWYSKLKCLLRDMLVKEVLASDRIGLLRNINKNVFGKVENDKNRDRIEESIAAMNEHALGIKLYCDDALSRIPLLDDNSISLVVTDPPYNTTDHGWDQLGTPEEFLAWMTEWLEVVRPKLKADHHLFVFCAPEYMADIEKMLLGNNWPIKSRIIWQYRNLVKGRDVSDKFIVNFQVVFHCGTHALNWPLDWDDSRFAVQTFATPQSNFKEGKYHPTSKPVELIKHFVALGSKPGDIVIDMFAGGGTTGAACNSLGQRQCILIDKSSEYCKIIEDRFGIKRDEGVV